MTGEYTYTLWWEPFHNQLAALAARHHLDLSDDIGMGVCICLLSRTAAYN